MFIYGYKHEKQVSGAKKKQGLEMHFFLKKLNLF